MRLSSVKFRTLAALVLAGLIVLVGSSEARQINAPPTTVPVPAGLKLPQRNALDLLKKGQKNADTPEAVRAVAKLMAYSLAHFPVDGSPTGPDGKPRKVTDDDASTWITAQMNTYFSIPVNTKLSYDQANYLAEVSKALDVELKFVFEKDPRTMVKLNAVRFMSEIARGPNPSLAKTFLEIINEKLQSEAYKNYAYLGLRNLLLQRGVEDREKPIISSDDPKLLDEICKGLEAAVLGKDNRWAGQPPDVVRFIRCKAVMALGAVPFSAVRIRKTEILARPITALLRVAVADPAIQPSPSAAERAEAIIGLCSMTIDPNINLDVLAYGVDKAMLDLISIQGAQSESKVSTLHWKAAGARLGIAFEGWKVNGAVGRQLSNAQNPKTTIWEIADQLKEVADALEANGLDAKPPVTALATWAQTRRPTSDGDLLFKDDPTSKFNFPK